MPRRAFTLEAHAGIWAKQKLASIRALGFEIPSWSSIGKRSEIPAVYVYGQHMKALTRYGFLLHNSFRYRSCNTYARRVWD